MLQMILRMMLVLAVLGLGAQAQHPEKPSYCINHDGHPQYPRHAPHICECKRSCAPDAPEDTQCTTYCFRPRCKCLQDC